MKNSKKKLPGSNGLILSAGKSNIVRRSINSSGQSVHFTLQFKPWQKKYQREVRSTWKLARTDIAWAWLTVDWKSGKGGSCKGCTGPPAYAQSCPAVIWGVPQLLSRRITMKCTQTTASTKLSISSIHRTSNLPLFSLRNTLNVHACTLSRYSACLPLLTISYKW